MSTDLLRLLKQAAAHQNATQHSSLNANSIINSDESETKQKMAGKIQAGNQELVVFSLAIIFLILVLAIIFLLIFVLVVLRDGFDRVCTSSADDPDPIRNPYSGKWNLTK